MIDDPAAFILANTLLQPTAHAPQIRLHVAAEITPIWKMTEEALGQLGLEPPFWAFAWAGGQALARYLLDHPHEAAGRDGIDFASGSGLVAIAAVMAGARSMLAADIDPFCAAAVTLNAAANGVAVAYTGVNLLDAPPPRIALITAGDICYDKPVAERVLAWLAQAHAAGTRVLIGDPGRTYFPRTGLVQLAQYEVPTTRELEDMEIKRAGVWTFPAA